MREISLERLIKDVRRVLESPFWIPSLTTTECYSRLHDDHDGTFMGSISVGFSQDGDAWVGIDGVPSGTSLRFRTSFGGGKSERVRSALMILAFAIQLDNEEHPQHIPDGGENGEAD